MIPKNSRVQINRVVRNIGPALAGGTITLTHKENEHLTSLKLKSQKMQEKMLLNQKTVPIEQQQQQQPVPLAVLINQEENIIFNELSSLTNSPKLLANSQSQASPPSSESMSNKRQAASPVGDASSLYSDILNLNDNENENESSSSCFLLSSNEINLNEESELLLVIEIKYFLIKKKKLILITSVYIFQSSEHTHKQLFQFLKRPLHFFS
jgi:hypothetical protein